jgi:hypothetical protein
MQTRQERVYLETPRHRIAGTLTLARDGYRSRVSDVLNASERDFIPLTDVTVELVGQEGPGTHHDFLAVSRGARGGDGGHAARGRGLSTATGRDDGFSASPSPRGSSSPCRSSSSQKT